MTALIPEPRRGSSSRPARAAAPPRPGTSAPVQAISAPCTKDTSPRAGTSPRVRTHLPPERQGVQAPRRASRTIRAPSHSPAESDASRPRVRCTPPSPAQQAMRAFAVPAPRSPSAASSLHRISAAASSRSLPGSSPADAARDVAAAAPDPIHDTCLPEHHRRRVGKKEQPGRWRAHPDHHTRV